VDVDRRRRGRRAQRRVAGLVLASGTHAKEGARDDGRGSRAGAGPRYQAPCAFTSDGDQGPCVFTSDGDQGPCVFTSDGDQGPCAFTSDGDQGPCAFTSGGEGGVDSRELGSDCQSATRAGASTVSPAARDDDQAYRGERGTSRGGRACRTEDGAPKTSNPRAVRTAGSRGSGSRENCGLVNARVQSAPCGIA
jgi:hypothetical protein